MNDSEFVSLSDNECSAVVGGGPLDWFVKLLVGLAVSEIIKYSTEFKQGVRDGWNSVSVT